MFISLGEFNLKSLFFILVPLFLTFREYLETFLEKENKNIFFNTFLRFSSRSLNGIFWIIFKRSMSFQKERENKIESFNKQVSSPDNNSQDIELKDSKFINQFEIERRKTNKLEINKKNIEKITKKTLLFMLFFIAFLDFSSVYISLMISELKIQENISLGLLTLFSCSRILILGLLSFILILHQKSYSHHYFSAISIGIVGILMLMLSFFFEKAENSDFGIKFILMIIPEISFSFMYTYGTLYIIKTDGNLYKVLCVNGLVGLILSIIIQIILSFFNCSLHNSFIDKYYICDEKNKLRTILFNFKSFDNFNGFISISIIILNLFENIFIFLLIYSFSLNHYATAFPVSSIILHFLKNTYSNNSLRIPYIIGSIIIIIMTLVYNEIIILRFFGLDKNTKIEIQKRSQIDFNMHSSSEDNKLISEGSETNDDDSHLYCK